MVQQSRGRFVKAAIFAVRGDGKGKEALLHYPAAPSGAGGGSGG